MMNLLARMYFIIFLCMFFNACGVGNIAGIRKYQSISLENLEIIKIDKVNRKISYGEKVNTELVICDDDQWHCFSDGYLSFAIQKNWPETKKQSWIYKGIRYTVVEPTREFSYSRDPVVHYIRAQAEKKLDDSFSPKVFMYTVSDGVVGFVTYNVGVDGLLSPVIYTEIID